MPSSRPPATPNGTAIRIEDSVTIALSHFIGAWWWVMILAVLSFTAGMILDTVTRGRREAKRMHYLAVPAVGNRGRRRGE